MTQPPQKGELGKKTPPLMEQSKQGRRKGQSFLKSLAAASEDVDEEEGDLLFFPS